MHPDQFAMGLECMKHLPNHCTDVDALRRWYSVFNGVQIISNQETPLHRDNGTAPSWLDLLATIGPYRSATFQLPGAGINLNYPSGTVVAQCGRLLRHGATKADGERICIAYYMKANVHGRVGTSTAGWSYLK